MKTAIEEYTPDTIVNITLPTNIPLMCDAVEAERLFGVSRSTLYGLARRYPDFPMKTIGRGVRYLVPDMYMWFRDFPDRIIELEKCTKKR